MGVYLYTEGNMCCIRLVFVKHSRLDMDSDCFVEDKA